MSLHEHNNRSAAGMQMRVVERLLSIERKMQKESEKKRQGGFLKNLRLE